MEVFLNMKSVTLLLIVSVLHFSKSSSIFDFKATDIHGLDVDFNIFKGKVLLIVNVASECGFTDSHYKELQRISVSLTVFHRNRSFGFGRNQAVSVSAETKQFR